MKMSEEIEQQPAIPIPEEASKILREIQALASKTELTLGDHAVLNKLTEQYQKLTRKILQPDVDDPRASWDWEEKEKVLLDRGLFQFQLGPGHSCFEPAFSSDGERMAIQARDKRKGMTIIVNGIPWPEWFKYCGPPVISPDGIKVAACILMKTEKEKMSMTIAINGIPWRRCFPICESPIFSPDSKKVVATVKDTMATPAYRLISELLSEDTADAWIYDKKPLTIAVNGIPWQTKSEASDSASSIDSLAPVFSHDSERIAILVKDSKKGVTMVVDDKPWQNWFLSYSPAIFTPDSKRVAASVGTSYGETIAVDDQLWQFFRWCGYPVSSPDSKHIAVKISDENKKEGIVVDGSPLGTRFEYCSSPFFTQNGEIITWVKDRKGSTIAINGIPQEGCYPDDLLYDPVFSSDGKVWAGMMRNEDNKITICVNGIPWKLDWPRNFPVGDIILSPDGKNIATTIFTQDEAGLERRFDDEMYKVSQVIIVNGELLPERFRRCWNLVFSPDGGKIMAVVEKLDGNFYRIVKKIAS